MASRCAAEHSVSVWVRPGPLDSGVIGPYERQSGEQRFSLSVRCGGGVSSRDPPLYTIYRL